MYSALTFFIIYTLKGKLIFTCKNFYFFKLLILWNFLINLSTIVFKGRISNKNLLNFLEILFIKLSNRQRQVSRFRISMTSISTM